ncbi:MAG: hypothetical protein DMF21_02780 [Verrucomicrobia bacterium]|nr:MAG: hypothetical protein DMF21_02780 [Verrucomicrobiota bacterium]
MPFLQSTVNIDSQSQHLWRNTIKEVAVFKLFICWWCPPRAVPTFREAQRAALTRHIRIVPLNLPTIELAGGSARCMLATIHLLLL